MTFTRSKIFLNKDIDIYIAPRGFIYIKGPLGITSSKLFFSFNFTNKDVSRSFRNSTIRHLFSVLKFGASSVTLGYYVFIDLVGLGYKIKKVTNLVYRFYLGQSHYVYIYVPSDVLF